VVKVAEEEEQMYPQRRMVKQTLRLGLVVLVVFALSACGSGGGAKNGAEKASKPELTTVAGDGGEQLGDGGPATEAGFCGTNDVAFDTTGNMYISDGGSIAADPAAIPFGRWILMGPSRPWRAAGSLASPAMAGTPPRHNSISPSP
jgi:hypothetical protein